MSQKPRRPESPSPSQSAWPSSAGRETNNATAKPTGEVRAELTELEPRVLFSGVPADVFLDQVDALASLDVEQTESWIDTLGDGGGSFDYVGLAEGGLDVITPLLGDASFAEPFAVDSQTSAELLGIVFIDSGVANADALIASIAGASDGAQFEVVMLDATRNGIDQITQALSAYTGVQQVHIVSHGTAGQVVLGNTLLNLVSAQAQAEQLASWSQYLGDDADILFYGCDLAATDEGQSLVDFIAGQTEADVAASDDVTGHEDLGGDWDLEYAAGVVDYGSFLDGTVWYGQLDLAAVSGEILVNTSTPENQTTTVFGGGNLAMDDAGNYVVVWEDYRSGNADSYAKVFNADGSVRVNEFRVHAANSSAQDWTNVAMADNGNFVVTWSDNRSGSYETYMRLFDIDGTALTAETMVSALTGAQDAHAVDFAADGSFVVTFQSASDTDIYFQRYNASGVAQGSNTRVNTTTTDIQNHSDVAVNDDGSFIVTWMSNNQDGDNYGFYGQRFTAAGAKSGSEFRINQTTVGAQWYGTVDSDASGNFVTTWMSDDGNGYGIYARLYDASGSALGNEFQVNTWTSGNQGSPNVAVDDDGDFVISWHDASGHDGAGLGVYAQQYDSSGNAIGGETQIAQTTGNDQKDPTVAINGTSAVIVWGGNGSQAGQSDSSGVFFRQFSLSGVSDITSNLAVHLSLDDGSGTVANDQTANNNDGSVNGTATWTSGPVGGAFEFDPSNGEDYIEIANSPTLENVQENDYSLAAWFRPDSTPPGSGSDNDANYGVLIKSGWHNGIYFNSDNRFLLDHQFSDGTSLTLSSTNTFALGQFHHVVAIIDRDAGTAALYVNGQLEDSDTFTANKTAREYGTETWKLGIASPGGGTWGWPADGAIDDARIYSRAITSSEVTELYNLGGPIVTSITFQQGDANGYSGTQDTELQSNNSGTNYGSASSITVDLDNGAGVSQAMVRFDDLFGGSAGQIPLEAIITSASLSFESASSSVQTIGLYQMLQDWNESTATWDSLSGGLNADGVEMALVADSTVTGPAGTVTFAGLEQTVQNWLTGGSNFGWGIISDGTDGWDFQTSEGAIAPLLTVNYVMPGTQTSANHTVVVDTTADIHDGDVSSIDALLSNKGADGKISLREAILATNATANDGSNPDQILFGLDVSDPGYVDPDAIPGNGNEYWVIQPTAFLGFITDPIVLDATTQAGYDPGSGRPVIEIDGSMMGSGTAGLVLRTSDSTIRGFAIHSSPDEGIEIDGSTGYGDNNTIQNNWVGLDAEGNVLGNTQHGIMISSNGDNNLIGGTGSNSGNVVGGAPSGFSGVIVQNTSINNFIQGNLIGVKADGVTLASNAGNGILVTSSSTDNVIGGSANGAGNVISGNGQNGIYLDADGNTVQGNRIGTDATGTLDRGNSGDGIQVNGSNNVIGGSLAGDRNVISGNSDEGIDINAGANGTLIQGNYIGTNASGNAAIPNGAGGEGNWGGILVGGDNTTIGGVNAGEGNVISGNHSWGIMLESNNNVVQGNLIGTAVDGISALGNSGHGISVTDVGGGLNNLIGGTAAGAGNVIAHNGLDGIAVTGNAQVTVLGNTIYGNTWNGIDLGNNGVTTNDGNDTDPGPNNLQNFPVITQADLFGTTLTVSGMLDTDGLNTQYRIEFFGNPAGTQDAGFGEGRYYLGSTTVTTNGSGDATFTGVALTGVFLGAGDFISGTATKVVDPGQIGTDDAAAFSVTSEFAANFAIALINTAPTLNGANNVATIDEDEITNSGTLVSDLLAGQVTDPDSGAGEGIAVVGVDNTNGTWEYTTDGGTTWTAFGAVSSASARLLAADTDTRVRFVPDANWTGTVNQGITFHAWDQTTGTNGGTADLTADETVRDEFSAAAYNNQDGSASWAGDWFETNDDGTATSGSVRITGGQLRLDNIGDSEFESIARAVDLSGVATAYLTFDFTISTQVDPGDSTLIEISSDGGSNWTVLEDFNGLNGPLSDSRIYDISAYATADTQIRFRLNADMNGSGEYFYVDNVEIAYSAGGSGVGGTTAFSASSASSSITVIAINDDPTNAGSLPSDVVVTEDVTTNIDLSAVDFSDIDATSGSLTVTLSTSTGGQLTAATGVGITIGGTASSLTMTGTLADLNAYFDDPTKLSYLHGTPHTFGNDADTIQVVINDNGNTGSGGGTDQNLGTVHVDITAVNDAPVLDPNGTMTLATITEDDITNSGNLVSEIIASAGGDRITDVDGDDPEGIAIFNLISGNGTWQYNTGSGWLDVGTVSITNSLLLRATDSLRFVPDGLDGDNAFVTFAAWDQSTGTAGTKVDTSVYGGATAFSDQVETAAIVVTAVNDAPSGTDNTIAINEDATYTLTAADFGFTDPDGDGFDRVWIMTLPGLGELKYNGATFAAGNSVSKADLDLGLLTFEPATNGNGTGYASFDFQVQDDGGTAYGGADRDTTSNTITFDVVAQNDDPTNAGTLPSDVVVTEDILSNVDLSVIDFSDVDAGSGSLTVTLSTSTGGQLTAYSAGGVTVSGTATSRTFTASLADLNAYFNNPSAVQYLHGTPDTSGNDADTIQVVINDNGNTGVGGGADQSLGTVSVDITSVNDDPTLNLGPGGGTYYENAAGVYIDTLATVTDADGLDFDGGVLTTWISNNGTADDRLFVRHEGTGAGQVNVSGSAILIDGVTIGSISGGNGDADPLLVTFNANADATDVEKVVRRISFRVDSDDPSGLQRTVSMQLTDGDGGTSAIDTRSENVIPVNDTPTATAPGSALAATELVDLAIHGTGFTLSDVDAQSGAMTITLDVASGILTVAAGDSGITIESGNGTGSVVVSGTVTQLQGLLTGSSSGTIFYNTNSATPPPSTTITLTVNDGGNTGIDPGLTGDATSEQASAAQTIAISAVNNAPVLTPYAPVLPLTEDSAAYTNTVASLLGSSVSDADGDPEGIAVTDISGANGTLEYSIDGGAWTAIGSPSSSSALLLKATDQIRFTPNGVSGGSMTMTYRAWDQSAGTAGSTVDVSVNGGSTAFSSATDVVTINTTEINDAPSGADNTIAFNEDTTYTLTVADFGFSDIDGDAFDRVWIMSLPAQGQLLLNGSTFAANSSILKSDIDLGLLTYEPAADANGTGYASFQFQVQDDGGTANGGLNRDATSNTITFDVTAQNDDPVVDHGGPYLINEGDSLNLDASGTTDVDSGTLTYRWDLNNDAIYDVTTTSATLTPTWSALTSYGIDDDGVYTIGLQVDDGSGGVVTTSTTVVVANVGPTVTATGAATTGGGATYTLTLTDVDPGDDTISQWIVNWGDGSIDTYVGDPSSVTHVYANDLAGLTLDITVSAIDEDGQYFAATMVAPAYVGDYATLYRGYDAQFLDVIALASDGISGHANVVITASGNYLISGIDTGNILEYQPDGTLVGEFIAAGTGGLNNPGGMAFGPDGNLYVADYGGNEVLRFDGATGAFIDAFVPNGTPGLNSPLGLEFGPDGNLYVASRGSAGVLKFDGITGVQDTSFVVASISGAEDLTFGPDGNIYVGSVNGVIRVDALTGATSTFIANGVGGLGLAAGLDFGPDGHLYVADQDNDVIRRYDGSTGAYIDDYASGIDGPAYMDFTADHRVTVTNSNQSPVVATNTGATVDEGSTANTITTAMLDEGDPDDDGAELTYTVTSLVSNGTLRLNGTALGLNDTFTQADIDAGLVTYDHNGSETVADSFDFSLADGGENGSTPATGRFNITVNPVNDAPVLVNSGAPTMTGISEDDIGNAGMTVADLLLTGAGSDPISDPDGDPEGIAITTRNNGNGMWQYSIDGGSNWSNVGTVSETSALLLRSTDLIRFNPDGDNGITQTFEFRAWDQTSGAAGTKVDTTTNGGTTAFSTAIESASITVSAVNDDPFNSGTLPTDVTVTEDVLTAINLSAVNFSDVDAGGASLTVTLSTATGGQLTLAADGSLTFGGTSTAPTITGTLTNLNAYFDNASNIQYLHGIPHTYGDNADTITVVINDNGNTGSGGGTDQNLGTVNVDITAVNDAPLVGTNTGATVAEGGQVTITTAMLNESDVDDSGAGLTYAVTIGPTNGQLELTTAPGVAISSFTQDDIDSNRVIFVHDGTQASVDAFDFSLADGGEDGSTPATGTFNFTVTNVNDAPVASGIEGTALSYTENDGAVNVTSTISFTDVDDTNIESAVVQISRGYNAGEDVLSFTDQNGITGVYDGLTGTWTLTGSATLADYETAIRSIAYTNASENPDTTTRTVSFTVNDGDANSNTLTRDITIGSVNDDPTNAGSLPTDVTVTEDVLSNVDLSAVDFSDVDHGGGLLTVTLSTATGGQLTAFTGGGVTVGGTATSLTLTGTLTDLNTYFDNPSNVQYLHGTPHTFGNDADTITVVVNDNGNTGTGGGTDQNLGTVNVDITAVNDDPTNAGSLPTDITVTEDVSTNFDLSAIDFSDVDHSGGTLTVTLSTSTGGQLTAAAGTGITIGGTSSALTLTGSLTDLNNYFNDTTKLAYLHSTPHLNGNDADTITVVINDNGNTGSGGGTDQNLGTVNVDLTAVNDEEVLATNAGTTVAEGSTGNVLTTAMLHTTDVDNTDSQLVYTIDALPAHGTLRLSGTALAAGGTFTQADIDAGNLTYDHDGSENRNDSFDFTVDDGAGSSTTATFAFTMTNVNDAPYAMAPNSFSINENVDTTGGHHLGVLVASDTDPGDSFTYSIVGGADAGLFSIGGPAGDELILAAGVTDYESVSSYSVRVRATDAAGAWYEQDVTVNVIDVNEAPSLGLSNVVSTLSESVDTAAGIRIADINITDDALGTNDLTLSGADAGLFEIVGNELRLVAGAVLDYESQTSLVVNIAVDDASVGGTPDDLVTHTVLLTDHDEFDVTLPADANGAVNSVAENSPGGAQVGLTAFASDNDGTTNAITYSLLDDAGGRFAIDASTGQVTTVVGIDYESASSHDIVVQATSADGSTASQSFTIQVEDVNELPSVVAPVTVMAIEDTPVAIVGVNLQDVDGNITTVTLSAGNGSLTVSLPGSIAVLAGANGSGYMVLNGTQSDLQTALDSLTYLGAANFNGFDSVTIVARDVGGLTASASTAIDVQAVNDAPVAVADAAFVNEDAAISGFNVLTNDFDVEGDPVTATLVSGPTHAESFVLNSDGTFQYQPVADFYGTDSFAYRINDGVANSAPVVVTITIAPVNDVPVGIADTYSVAFGEILNSPASVVANDTDVENDALTGVLLSAPSHGVLLFQADGNFVYLPDPGFFGVDQFVYLPRDGADFGQATTVTIEVLVPGSPTGGGGDPGGDDGGGTPDGGDSAGAGGSGGSLSTGNNPQAGNTGNDATSVAALLSQSRDLAETADTIRSASADSSEESDATFKSGFSNLIGDLLATDRKVAQQAFIQILERGGVPTAGQASEIREVMSEGMSFVYNAEQLWQQASELERSVVGNARFEFDMTTSLTVTTVSAVTGIVLWTLRGGFLVATLASSLPTWTHFDPLPILDGSSRKVGGAVHDHAESLFD